MVRQILSRVRAVVLTQVCYRGCSLVTLAQGGADLVETTQPEAGAPVGRHQGLVLA